MRKDKSQHQWPDISILTTFYDVLTPTCDTSPGCQHSLGGKEARRLVREAADLTHLRQDLAVRHELHDHVIVDRFGVLSRL